MNAQVETNEVTQLNPDLIRKEVSSIVAAIKEAKADKAKSGKESESAISIVRMLAVQAHAAGKPIDPIADYMHQTMIAAEIPKGSADPYRVAIRGYAVALSEGVPIEAGHGGKDNSQPLPASKAREYAQYTKAERAERAEIAEVRGEISKVLGRASGMVIDGVTHSKLEMLQIILSEITALVPAATADEAGEVKTTVTPDESLLTGLFQAAA